MEEPPDISGYTENLNFVENEINDLWNGEKDNITDIDPKNNNWVEELNYTLHKLGNITSLLKGCLDTLDYPEMIAYLVKNQKIMQNKIKKLETLREDPQVKEEETQRLRREVQGFINGGKNKSKKNKSRKNNKQQ